MVNEPTSPTEDERRQAYLRCVCATLNFDVGEIWSWRNEDHDSYAAEDPCDDGSNDGQMRFVQLYTSPSFRDQRSKLVTPCQDWEESHTDVSKHKFSPLICEAVRDGGGVVWANTEVQEGLLGRSDLPLRTAVGAPIYTHGRELGVLVLFSPALVQHSASTMAFLYTLAQAASAYDTTDAFLPALASSFPLGPSPPPPTVALRASASWQRGSSKNRLRRLDELRASLPVDVMFQTLAMGQMPNPERSLRAVRSAYNDPRRRVVVGAGGTIPAEFFRPGGGGLMLGNRSGRFVSPGTLTTSDINTRVTGASNNSSSSGGGGDNTAKRTMSPLTLGGGRAGGTSGGGTLFLEDGGGGGIGGGDGRAGSLGWLVLPGEEGGVAEGAQTPLRRGSFQSTASVDFGLSISADESVLDSEEYSLWAAFMKPDSPPGSPLPCTSPECFCAEPLAGEGRDVDAENGRTCVHSASYQTLSELLSTNVGTGSVCGDEDDDDDDSGEDIGKEAGDHTRPLGSAPGDLFALKQEFAGSLLKQELEPDGGAAVATVGKDWGGAGGTAAGTGDGGGKQMLPYALLPEKRVFSSSESTTTSVAAGSCPGSSATMSEAAGAATMHREHEAKVLPGAVLAARNAPLLAKTVATERRGFVGDEQKRKRFEEFIMGFLSMSMFQAADIWLPFSSRNSSNGSGGDRDAGGVRGGGGGGGGGGGRKGNKISRLFLYSSKVQDPALEKWSHLSQNVVLASGVGLPGIVFQERRPQWAVDYSQVDSERNPLASVARLLGIGSAFGVPLSIGTDECGVLMLYSVACLSPSELMVEFMERATRLLLDDGPAPTTVVQQFREKPPSAKDIGRVAGAYQHHALWAEHQVRSNSNGAGSSGGSKRRSGGAGSVHNLFPQDGNGYSTASNNNGQSSPELVPTMSESAAVGWGGAGAALAVAAVAAASGGQGGGFRPDGGAVAFVRPPDWPGNEASPPPFLFNRVDLDSRPSIMDKRSRPAAAAAMASLDVKSAGSGGGRSSSSATRDSNGGGGGGGHTWVCETATTNAASKGKPKGRSRATAVASAATKQAAIQAAEEASRRTLVGAGRRGGGGGGGRKVPPTGARGGRASSSARPAQVYAMKPTLGRAPPAAPGATSVACRAPGCGKDSNGRTMFCWDHWSAARQCQHSGCDKLSQGNTRLCIAHGGGRRCTHPGCNKGARDRFFCAAHGGGKRCSMPECGKAAVGGSDLCTGHGGGKRCQFPNCPKSAQSKTNFCVRHGGGRKCSVAGCLKVARGRTPQCAAHGGGVRCCVDSCNKAAVGRERMCRSHQRRSKNTSAAAAAAAAATAVAGDIGATPASPSSLSASSSRSASPGSAALTVLSTAAATHSEFLEPTTAGGGGGVPSPMMSSSAAAAAVAATTTTNRASYGGVDAAPRWGIPVVGGAGGSRKRSAAMAMAGGGPADDMGGLRGGAGGQLSFRLASPFPP